jgi:hypothetical protein
MTDREVHHQLTLARFDDDWDASEVRYTEVVVTSEDGEVGPADRFGAFLGYAAETAGDRR